MADGPIDADAGARRCRRAAQGWGACCTPSSSASLLSFGPAPAQCVCCFETTTDADGCSYPGHGVPCGRGRTAPSFILFLSLPASSDPLAACVPALSCPAPPPPSPVHVLSQSLPRTAPSPSAVPPVPTSRPHSSRAHLRQGPVIERTRLCCSPARLRRASPQHPPISSPLRLRKYAPVCLRPSTIVYITPPLRSRTFSEDPPVSHPHLPPSSTSSLPPVRGSHQGKSRTPTKKAPRPSIADILVPPIHARAFSQLPTQRTPHRHIQRWSSNSPSSGAPPFAASSSPPWWP